MIALADLGVRLQAIADTEQGERRGFWGKPERWWDGARFRCPGDHVSRVLLKTEKGCVCMGRHGDRMCGQPAWLTFPEDVDGPLALEGD